MEATKKEPAQSVTFMSRTRLTPRAVSAGEKKFRLSLLNAGGLQEA
jgi:hypothetical protein